MKGFKISSVRYHGDGYSFYQDKIPSGVVVIEGENGSGKSTFASLVSYGLGADPLLFRQDNTEKHVEILKDTNNYVELGIAIKGEDFVFKRSFTDVNELIVYGGEEKVQVLYLKRTADEARKVFSDWFLSKLGVPFYKIFNGVSSGILNFNDLYRLLYYDQSDSAILYSEVHKSNRVADSIFFRRAIFESFQGVNFGKLYTQVEKFKLAEAEHSRSNAILKDAEKIYSRLGVDLDRTPGYYEKEIEAIDDRIKGIKQKMPKIDSSKSVFGKTITDRQREIGRLGIEVSNLEINQSKIHEQEIAITNLLLDSRSEIEVTKRLLVSKKQLDFFSGELCPCCFKPVERKKDHCICGAPIGEDEYQRFFYHENEYKESLKARVKSLASTEEALKDIQLEAGAIVTKIGLVKEKIKSLSLDLDELLKKDIPIVDVIGLSELNEQVINLLELKRDHESGAAKLREYTVLKKTAQANKESFKKEKTALEAIELEVHASMENALVKFEATYKNLIVGLVNKLNEVDIDRDSYLPILNKGYHLEASSYVSKRLMYYLTVMLVGGVEGLNHPRFMLIDTPQTKGIDKDRFSAALEKLNALYETFADDFQVILTTGIGTVSEKLKHQVILELRDKDGERLLKKNGKLQNS